MVFKNERSITIKLFIVLIIKRLDLGGPFLVFTFFFSDK